MAEAFSTSTPKAQHVRPRVVPLRSSTRNTHAPPSPYSPPRGDRTVFLPVAQQPKLLDRVRAAIRPRHYSLRTEDTYLHWIQRFLLFHGQRHPAEMGAKEIGQFLSALAVDHRVSASTQNQALNAILFVYRHVLDLNPGWIDNLVRAKQPHRLPVVLRKHKGKALLETLEGVHWLMGHLLYGAGLRLMECLRLRVKDIDFSANHLVVREGKGNKDRITMLPLAVKAPLVAHLARVRALHQHDLATASAVYICPTLCTGNILTHPNNGAGNGCFPRPRCPSIRGLGNTGAIICTRPSCNAQSAPPRGKLA
ncbi:MAG: phage integrase N-terminal SAM-like domain-containing protein [Deltaproteobacteria bacterium]|nr:phage integrase N-terminal SAM-like domain-containing protein [Deltaproteobacteria bacterium]